MTEFKAAPVKQIISVDVLDRIDVRVGTIELVEDVKGSDKLVRLMVDFGDRKKAVIVGMKKERADPKESRSRRLIRLIAR